MASGAGSGPVDEGRKGKLVNSSRWIPRVTVGAFAAAGALGVFRRLSAAGEVGVFRGEGAVNPADVYEAHGFARRRVATPVGEMVYHEAGEGRPLVFLHGIGGGASSWIWSKVAPAFVGQHRVIVPDWVGWGQSHHPRRLLIFDDYVAELRALMREVVGEPAVVVAQSLAAGFAAELARTDPDLFAGLVMLAPSGGKDFGRDAFGPLARFTLTPLARSRPLNLLLYRLVFHSRSFIRSWLVSQGFYDSGAVSREVVDGFLWSARRPGAAYSALPFVTGDLRYDFAPYMQDLAIPAAMIWGSEERQVGTENGERLAALNPGVPLTYVRRARATPELELPAQTIAAVEASLRGLSTETRKKEVGRT